MTNFKRRCSPEDENPEPKGDSKAITTVQHKSSKPLFTMSPPTRRVVIYAQVTRALEFSEVRNAIPQCL